MASIIVGLATATIAGTSIAGSTTAQAIYKEANVKGGLVVHAGCGDGQWTASLRVNGRYLVHGLASDPAQVAKARAFLHSKGLYGQVAVDTFDGQHLPYVDNLINLVVVTGDASQVTLEELARVLAPNGVAMIDGRRATRSSPLLSVASCDLEGWTKLVKPRPEDIDEWSHFLHDAGGNAVAQDREVGPPKHLRWVAEPRWCRSHENPSSVNAVVMAGGRVLTILDEGPIGVFQKLPWRCHLIARDASSGVLLWKVPLQQWQPEFGTGTGGRWAIHHTIPRRLVAEGDRVYVTLRFLDSPVSVLDAATGQILIEALEGTRGTDELILSDGVLVTKITQGRSVGATERFGKESLHETLAAVDVRTGRQLWRREKTRVVPYALSADSGRVVYHNMEELVCLDLRTGKTVWTVPHVIRTTVGGGSTLAIADGVVLFHGHGQPAGAADDQTTDPTGGTAQTRKKKQQGGAYLSAIDLGNGKVLWHRRGSRSLAGACTQPADLFVVHGIVWCGNSLDGYDLKTGDVRKTLSLMKLISPGHHYRCHRAKATERFLIWPKRGAEFVDVVGEEHMRNDWLRAPCFTGLTPANGLLYVPPSQCFCYPGVKVSGFLAMSAKESRVQSPESGAARRLERGPAFGSTVGLGPLTVDLSSDWPMHRHDGQRSGSTATSVPESLRERWKVELACQGTQPVVVGSRVWIAEKDAHHLHCLNASDGREIWSFTAGGRIDSAPTIDAGRVVFGCRDGSVYCLRATDGKLIWRFLAAPEDRRVVSFGQIESVWPVHGSVLVQDNVVYCAAGRSSFLDGGIRVYGLDAQSGQVLYQHLLEGPWPDISQDEGAPFAMEGALPDLIVSDGTNLYMRRIKFDPHLNRLETPQESPLGELDMGADHLAATGGFLDDTGFDRLYWMHSRRWPGFYFSEHAPKSGQLVVFDDRTTYAVKYFYRRIQWSPAFFPGEDGYLLYADDNDNEPVLQDKGKKIQAIEWLPRESYSDKYRKGGRGVEKGTGYVRQQPAKWQKMIPQRVRAMVLAGDRLFTVGIPDVVDPKDPLASFEGRDGAQLQVFSAKDGSPLRSYPLASPPAFDGLSAAGGRLYLATKDGKVICFGRDGT